MLNRSGEKNLSLGKCFWFPLLIIKSLCYFKVCAEKIVKIFFLLILLFYINFQNKNTNLKTEHFSNKITPLLFHSIHFLANNREDSIFFYHTLFLNKLNKLDSSN